MAVLSDLRRPPLPSLAQLLVSGGDRRIMLDPQTGASRYGSRPRPDPALVELGSCTASLISPHAWDAAGALHRQLQGAVSAGAENAAYPSHLQHTRHALLAMLGADTDGTQAVFAASGTDLLMLAGQWLRPGCTVMTEPSETGSGVPMAVRGQHFDTRSAGGASQVPGAQISAWNGSLRTLATRHADGSARAGADIDADCAAAVNAAVNAGQSVLLVVTDVSKTGLIVPGIDCALSLRRRWPGQVEILVDACQFRLAPGTVRAYLRQGCLVALTGSKFLGGPTFSGALLLPAASVPRLRELPLAASCSAYSNAADWPSGWAAARHLPDAGNFGLLLRWRASLAELQRYLEMPPATAQAAVTAFAAAVRARLARDRCFEALPVPPLRRDVLQAPRSWDAEQTIFPFLVLRQQGAGGASRPLTREQTIRLHVRLRDVPDAAAMRYALGQPVACGERDGVPLAALRLCLGAPSLATADAATLIGQAMAALDRTAALAATI